MHDSLRMHLMIALLLFSPWAGVGATSDLPPTSPQTHADPILVDGIPPLECGDELCLRPLRHYFRDGRPASEEYGWWQSYGPDKDWNGMDDRLQHIIAGEASISPTAITGPDGRKTVAIVVDYAWHPGQEEIETLRHILHEHGWVGEEGGAYWAVMESIDSIVLDKVPVSALLDIWSANGVVVVEMQNVMVPALETSSKAARARPSEIYDGEAWPRGYTGEGVVIAILDTGVDNEHRSLNDFDDNDDEPDLDPNSYSDQKWLAGFDATSTASNPDGSQDPDDGQGHGTHVAGIALGTGHSAKQHIGAAPGAYLVDIKVLTDAGGTNSQYSISGIQWAIQNKDNNWGNNASSKGIDILSMSFGSVSNPFDTDDKGDNGTSAEARQVNNASINGLVCVVAMGNDGMHRVPSPASADGAISVGSASDRDSINRSDDTIASYSNWGPRESDGDEDDLDELKPDVVGYGSGIVSASAATGTSFPGQPRPMADIGYESKDGTSMSTPHVSGIIALMLQTDSSLTPEDIKQALRDSSELRGTPSETSIDDDWNNKWGWGLVDASCAIDVTLRRSCTPLDNSSGPVIEPPPDDNGTIDVVEITSPSSGSIVKSGEWLLIQGTADTSEFQAERIEVRLIQKLDGGAERELLNWDFTGGDVDNWDYNLKINDDWYHEDEQFTFIQARAIDDSGQLSKIATNWANIVRFSISLFSPSSNEPVQDVINVNGQVEGTEHDIVEYSIDGGDWILGEELEFQESGVQDFSFNWDSNTVDDGTHRIDVKFTNESGYSPDSVRRTFKVDNQPPAPSFTFRGSVEVKDQDLSVTSAVAGSVLEIHFEVSNIGDKDAQDVHVRLNAPGSESESYPSEGRIPSLDQGETASVILYWWATKAGEHQVEIEIDPSNSQGDPDDSDNKYSFTFQIDERPLEPTLRFLSGAVVTDPRIPRPNEPFEIEIRVDNLGRTGASGLTMLLERRDDYGWVEIDTKPISEIPGSETTSGYATVVFPTISDDIGGVQYLATLLGDGVEIAHSELSFGVAVDTLLVGGPVSLDSKLNDDEYVVDMIGIGEGAHLLTTRSGELHLRTLTSRFEMPKDILLEDSWAGEAVMTLREDGRTHIAWTGRESTPEGYKLIDIGMTSVDENGERTAIQHHLTPIRISEGSYWGLDLDSRGNEVVLAGYHRNISTGGSWRDVTSIFLLSSSTPDSESSWSFNPSVVTNVDIRSTDADSIVIALGEKYVHLLYEEYRDDVSGEERVGLIYAHGDAMQFSWDFQYSVGDNVSTPQMHVTVDDGEDIIFAAWRDGEGRNAKLAHIVVDSSWSSHQTQYTDAPGNSRILMAKNGEEIWLLYDEIGVRGPVIRYGLMSTNGSEVDHGLSDIISSGLLRGVANMEGDLTFMYSSTSGTLYLQTASSTQRDTEVGSSPTLLDKLLAPLPGDRKTQLAILSGIGISSLMLLMVVIVSLRRLKRHNFEEEEEKDFDEDLELVIDPDTDELIAIDRDSSEEIVITIPESESEEVEEPELELTLAESLEKDVNEGKANLRMERRIKRQQERQMAEDAAKLAAEMFANPVIQSEVEEVLENEELPPAPLPGLPGFDREANCPKCDAKFTVKDIARRRVDCPVCDENFEI